MPRTDKLASKGGAQAWSHYGVLNVLYSLIQKSRINEWLRVPAVGVRDDEIKYLFPIRCKDD